MAATEGISAVQDVATLGRKWAEHFRYVKTFSNSIMVISRLQASMQHTRRLPSLVKGAGFRSLSCRSSRVRISPSAPSYSLVITFHEPLGSMPNRLETFVKKRSRPNTTASSSLLKFSRFVCSGMSFSEYKLPFSSIE